VTKDGYVLGALRNSERSTSVYLGRDIVMHGPFSITVGAITGYESRPVNPLLALGYRHGPWRVSLT
jgi:hypothetical protein